MKYYNIIKCESKLTTNNTERTKRKIETRDLLEQSDTKTS